MWRTLKVAYYYVQYHNMEAQVWSATESVNHPNCLFCGATTRRRVCAESQMRHFQLLGLKQLVGPLQADRNCARMKEMARNKQPMSNPSQNHSRWGAAALEERLRMLTFKAGTVRCFAVQPDFSRQLSDRAWKPIKRTCRSRCTSSLFARLECTFHPQMSVIVNHEEAKN